MAKTKKVKNVKKPLAMKLKKEKGGIKKKFQRDRNGRTSVVLLNHVPHGFYEPVMKKYFSQFGSVRRIKVGRSVKTGRNKDHAFIEFEDEDVAKIAAETMNNYLMFGKLMKCKVLPPSTVGKGIFANKLNSFRKKQIKKQKRSVTPAREKSFAKTIKLRIRKCVDELASLGINFKFQCPDLDSLNMSAVSNASNVIDSEEDEISFKTIKVSDEDEISFKSTGGETSVENSLKEDKNDETFNETVVEVTVDLKKRKKRRSKKVKK